MSEAAVIRYLASRGIAFAVIGERAMGIRGVVRFSDDTDLLTTSRAVLTDGFWSDLGCAGILGECDRRLLPT